MENFLYPFESVDKILLFLRFTNSSTNQERTETAEGQTHVPATHSVLHFVHWSLQLPLGLERRRSHRFYFRHHYSFPIRVTKSAISRDLGLLYHPRRVFKHPILLKGHQR